MCATLPKPARHARWLTGNPAWALANGYRAGLSITVYDRRGRPVTTCYWLERLDGGWRLRKEGAAEAHDIDTSFGPDAEHWSCTCGDYVWRRGPKEAQCKHVAAVFQALKRVGF